MRGFLGLRGYYRRFVKGYGIVSRPLTNTLKKHSFGWSEEAELAFEKLKEALCIALMLVIVALVSMSAALNGHSSGDS